MLTVAIVIHLLIVIALIALILLQKNEGNAAGGGFSVSSVTAMTQPRARPNPLSRATTILGISFFITSIGLALLTRQNGPPPSIVAEPAANSASAPKVDQIQVPTGEPTAPATTGAVPGAAPAPGTAPAAPPAGSAASGTPPTVPTAPRN